MTYRIEPIQDRTWIGQKKRETSRFTASWTDTVTMLEREVASIGGRNLLIRIDVTADQLKLDGTLRANARAGSPVVVEFESKHGDLTYRCDRYNGLSWRPSMTSLWQHNIRAVALTLESLRAVDRYGATAGEQYTGFKALGVGRAMPSSHLTSDQALHILRRVSGVRSADASNADLYKVARREAHPDRCDGDRTAWDEVEQAGAVLGVVR